jgi:hypothetical protein
MWGGTRPWAKNYSNGLRESTIERVCVGCERPEDGSIDAREGVLLRPLLWPLLWLFVSRCAGMPVFQANKSIQRALSPKKRA